MHKGIFKLQSAEACFIVCIPLKIQIYMNGKSLPDSGESSIMTAEIIEKQKNFHYPFIAE